MLTPHERLLEQLRNDLDQAEDDLHYLPNLSPRGRQVILEEMTDLRRRIESAVNENSKVRVYR